MSSVSLIYLMYLILYSEGYHISTYTYTTVVDVALRYKFVRALKTKRVTEDAFVLEAR